MPKKGKNGQIKAKNGKNAKTQKQYK